MRILSMLFAILISASLPVPHAFADGDAAKGKALFTDAGAFEGRKACNECHPGGRGLEKAGAKSTFKIMGRTQNSLEEAVNFCIVNANRGKMIDPKSKEMQDMVAYIKSLGKAAAPAYR